MMELQNIRVMKSFKIPIVDILADDRSSIISPDIFNPMRYGF